MEKQQNVHKCENQKRKAQIYHPEPGAGKFWRLSIDDRIVIQIVYCPYCGENLVETFNSNPEE